MTSEARSHDQLVAIIANELTDLAHRFDPSARKDFESDYTEWSRLALAHYHRNREAKADGYGEIPH